MNENAVSSLNSQITLQEVRHVIHQSKGGKASGFDNITAELLTYENSCIFLHTNFNRWFESGAIPYPLAYR